MSTKYDLLREVDINGAKFAVFRRSHEYKINDIVQVATSLEVFTEYTDVAGRPYWQEESDDGTTSRALEFCLLNPT